MKLIKVIFSFCLLVLSLPSYAQFNTKWILDIERDPFDDSIRKVKSFVMEKNNVGSLLVSCDVKTKYFLFGVMSNKYGVYQHNDKEFRYRIDRKDAVTMSMTSSFEGMAHTSKIDSLIVRDILKGGKKLIVQTSLNDNDEFISEFSLRGAKKVLARIVNECGA